MQLRAFGKHLFASGGLMALLVATSVPAGEPIAHDDLLQHTLEEIAAANDLPALAVAEFDATGTQYYLVGRNQAGLPLSEADTFHTGQLANLFTGLLLYSLVAEGTIGLDENIHARLPEVDIRNPWSSSHPIRLRHLLSHQSGLAPLHFRDLFLEQQQPPALLASINRAHRSLEAGFPPGTRTEYSQLGFAIAAYLAERATRSNYDSLLHTLYGPIIALADDAAVPVAAHARGKTFATMIPVFGSSTDAVMSLRQMAATGQLLINNGQLDGRQLLKPEVVAMLEDPAVSKGSYIAGMRRDAIQDLRYYSISGNYPGYLAELVHAPERDRGYVILMTGNEAHAAYESIRRELLFRLASGLPDVAAVVADAAPSPDISGYWLREAHRPSEKLLGELMMIARIGACNEQWYCWEPLSGDSFELQSAGNLEFRVRGKWQAGWRVAADGARLSRSNEHWRRIAGWRYYAGPMLVVIGLLLAMINIGKAPHWIALIWRGEGRSFHEWLPRLVPFIAVLAHAGWIAVFYQLDVFMLGSVNSATISILVFSLLALLTSLATLPLALFGIYWKILPASSVLNVATGICLWLMLYWLWLCDLLVLQTWNL